MGTQGYKENWVMVPVVATPNSEIPLSPSFFSEHQVRTSEHWQQPWEPFFSKYEKSKKQARAMWLALSQHKYCICLSVSLIFTRWPREILKTKASPAKCSRVPQLKKGSISPHLPHESKPCTGATSPPFYPPWGPRLPAVMSESC